MDDETDQIREIDAQLLHDSGWFPDATEISNSAAGGSGFQVYSVATPVMVLLETERETDPERWSERERELVADARLETLEMVIRELISSGRELDPVQIGLNVLVWAWDCQIPPLDSMTQEEIGALVAQGRAAICARHKRKVQQKKEATGALGTHNSRQKRVSIVKVYKESATGNRNRRLSVARTKLAQRKNQTS